VLLGKLTYVNSSIRQL